MNKRLYGMAPGGRMALDRARNRQQNFFLAQRQARAREQRDAKCTDTPSVTLDNRSRLP